MHYITSFSFDYTTKVSFFIQYTKTHQPNFQKFIIWSKSKQKNQGFFNFALTLLSLSNLF